MRYFWLGLFLLTIPAANWLIGNVGVKCIPDGPCLVPVGFGLLAPSGVLMIGVALVLRDVVHSQLGVRWAVLAIAAGALVSLGVSPAPIALASGIAFLLSEAADLLVYGPLRERRLILAVVASGVAGAVVDSAVFLWLAFGSLDFLAGQVVGKMWAALASVPIILIGRRVFPYAQEEDE
jgi:hypothetical protein